MTQDEKLEWLIGYLLKEDSAYSDIEIPADRNNQWLLLRSLMNIRPAKTIGKDFLAVQDEFLREETRRKGIVDILSFLHSDDDLYIWQGDITTLKCDAIVNAANSGMTGCYVPCHSCIDNTIHTFAGIQLCLECAEIMKRQGHEEGTGLAKITNGWNLPARHVIHTVGPIIHTTRVSEKEKGLLASCYRSCLAIADKKELTSIAFCCVSTGEFHFPNELAAEVAISTVRKYLQETGSQLKVLFNVFKDEDRRIYERLLRKHTEA